VAAVVNEERCNGCGACAEICPVEAIQIVDGKARVDAESCIECGVCETIARGCHFAGVISRRNGGVVSPRWKYGE
jgi:Fe-S-cluster-containing hydrogenase component 2